MYKDNFPGIVATIKGSLCLTMCREPMVVLLLWWSLACVVTISNGAANTITVLSDGNRTDCITNSSGIFCYSLSYAMNHLITDDTTVLLESPKIDVLERIYVGNVSNLVIQGHGIDSTTICFYKDEISFFNISGLKIMSLAIQLCFTEPHLSNDSNIYLFNCSNVVIGHVKISGLSGGLGFSLPRDDIYVFNSTFEHCYSVSGGVNVDSHPQHHRPGSYSQYNLTFENCIFNNNTNSYSKDESRSNRSTGHGGGLLIALDGAENVNIEILNCHFTSNRAHWGGGLFVGFRHIVSHSSLVVKDTVFAYNTASLGGGGFDVGFYEMINNNINNSVTIENVIFHQNSAGYGGGNTIFSDLGHQISYQDLNKVIFRNSTWKDNLANFSTAVDVSPNVYENTAGGFPVITKFYDCQFINNKVLSNSSNIRNTTKLYYRTGTLMITALPVEFGGDIIFEDNVGTGLHVVATKVTFGPNSNVTFANNRGSEGGAVALVGMATLLFSSNSTFLFVNNHADFMGGAIYWYSVDQHDYFSSRTCFLKKKRLKTDNVSFTFINNTAHSGIGHSIFATTLLPCGRHSYGSYNLSFEEIFSSKFFFFANNNPYHIATSGKRLVVNSSLNITPGVVFPLNASVYDEGDHDVSSITVFRNSIMQDSNSDSIIRLAKSYKYSSLSEVILYGLPGSTGKLLIKTDDVQGVSTVVDIKIAHCPPGFVLSRDETQFVGCKCSQDEYFGTTCIFLDAYIHKGYWAGYLDVNNATGPTPANLWTAQCPLAFCSYGGKISNQTDEVPLPNATSTTILDDFICGSNRTGELCGQCRDNFSVFFHSKQYSCKQESSLCKYGILFYILSELLPLTLLFIAILVMNISFTSGAVNGFILFAQVIDLLYVDAYGLSAIEQGSWFISIYQFIYGFFNLDFFNDESLSFCLWKGATVLDVLIFKYITTVFAVVLVFGLVVIVNYCTCWRICKCFRKQGFNVSVIQGLSAFLVMAYSQSTRVTFEILQGAMLQNGTSPKSSVKHVVRLAGNVEYLSWQHGYYAVPALVFLVFIVILPPSLLLVNPVLIKCAAFCQSRNYCTSCRSRYWLNKLLLIDLKPLFDSFQGCFKDSCRCFSGIYFLYRLVILLIRLIFPSLGSFYIAAEFFLVIFLVFHSSVQPYQKRWHNVLDTIIFGDLVIINGFSMFLYFIGTSHNELFFSNNLVKSFQLILIYWPMIYILAYTIIACLIKYKRINAINKFVSRFVSDSEYKIEDDMPARLLVSSSDSYKSF